MKYNIVNKYIKEQRGSITLFMCMTIMMITSLGFTLIETGRFYGLDAKASFVTSTVADNTFSVYIKPMWEQYGILGIDKAHGTDEKGDNFLRERILDFANMQTMGEVDYFSLNPTEVEIDDYMLLTDNNGEPFIHEAALYYKENLGSELISDIGDKSKELSGYEGLNSNVDKMITDGDNALKNPDSVPKGESDKVYDVDVSKVTEEQKRKGEHLVDDVSAFKSKGVLEQVIPSDKEVSSKTFDLANSVSHRNLEHGNSRNPSKATTVDKVIFSVYLRDKFQYYGKKLNHSGQEYEIEYIIAGKDNDTDNLKSIVSRLLAIREVANFIALYKDPIRNGEALELSVALAGITLNPAIIEIVHYALMAAWAYIEAVLDVRLLLDGGRIMPIKTSAEWTSDLYNIPACIDENFMAKNSEAGMSYEDYLLTFLVIEPSRDESMRALDMIETSMNALPYYENLKMDHLICDMNMTMNYEGDPMFFSLITLDVPFLDYYSLKKKEYRSYL